MSKTNSEVAERAVILSAVPSLEKEREKLREAAKADPRNAKLEALRVHRVTYKTRLQRTDLTSEETSNLRSALSNNQAEADALLADVHAPLVALQRKLSAARKRARGALRTEAAEALAGLSKEELIAKREELTVKRRELHEERKAVLTALATIEAEEAAAAAVAGKSDAEKKALFEQLSAEFNPSPAT